MPDDPGDHEVEGQKTIGEFLGEVGVPRDAVAIIMRNGKRAGPDSLLAEGDILEVFPLIGGG